MATGAVFERTMRSVTNPTLVEVTRGGRVESDHRGAIAICDTGGALKSAWGDVETPVFARSAFKSLQALPLVETGAANAFSVTDEELALACASHSGEAMHTERVQAWLRRLDCADHDLACGPHAPFHEPTSKDMVRNGLEPCRVHNNCSGKHTGFLTLARHLKAPIQAYENPQHPVQKLVRQAIAEMCGTAPDSMPIGIDGCAAPNYALPLKNLALAMAKMGTRAGLSADRANAASRLMQAWRKHPRLMSGTGRACGDLIEASNGTTVVKTGAEAVFLASIPEQGLGIALKIDDGGTRAAETAMARILVLLGAADASNPLIAKHMNPSIKNWRGDLVGERRTSPALATLGLFNGLD